MKIILFVLIFTLFTLENSHEVTTEEDHLKEEIVKLIKYSQDIKKFIENELSFFEGLHYQKITNIIQNIATAIYKKLNEVIDHISNTKTNISSQICVIDTVQHLDKVLKNHEITKSECISKAKTIKHSITSELHEILLKTINFTVKIGKELLNCEDIPSEEINKCLQEILKLKPSVEAIEKNLLNKIPIMHSTADKSIITLDECLQPLKGFNEEGDNTMSSHDKCIENHNSATSIHPRSVLYFCLGFLVYLTYLA